LVAWAVLGGLIGIAAALTKRFSVAAGIIGGLMLGPLAFLMFYRNVAKTKINPEVSVPLHERIIDYGARPYARRRCPECTGPNDYLLWHGATADLKGDDWGDFVPARRLVFTHRYRCVLCAYEWQFESPISDPDKPPVRVY
jgi:rubredoxin